MFFLHDKTICSLKVFSFYSGGAGGKGTWGKMTEAYDNEGHAKDSRDPNYDSQDEEVSVVANE